MNSGTISASRLTRTAELQTIINRANSEGFTLPSASSLRKLDSFIRTLKVAGVWQVSDYLRINAFNNLTCENFARINLVNPNGSLASIFGGISYQLNGFKGNASNGYIDSNVNLVTATHYSLNSASRLHVIAEAADSFSKVADGIVGTNFNGSVLTSSGLVRINQGANTYTTHDLTGIGLRGGVRTSASNIDLYVGNTVTSRVSSSTALQSGNQVEFRAQSSYSNCCIAFTFYGAALTSTQVETLRVAFNTYLTGIGLTAFA